MKFPIGISTPAEAILELTEVKAYFYTVCWEFGEGDQGHARLTKGKQSA